MVETASPDAAQPVALGVPPYNAPSLFRRAHYLSALISLCAVSGKTVFVLDGDQFRAVREFELGAVRQGSVAEIVSGNGAAYAKGIYMQRIDKAIVIEKAMVASSLASVPRGSRVSHYASAGANVEILAESLLHLSVTRYQLSGLLDIKPRPYVYALWSGRRRPSNLLLIRLIQLYHMQAEGVPVHQMKSIDWSTGTITWRDGHTSKLFSIVPDFGPGPITPASAPKPDQQAGQNGALPRSAPYRRKSDSGPVY